ncbi:J domain-containing protein [Marinicauda sp. Alg238-R41]|uniref:J domain-containing protein n=1 Tax=Marinicauda sp. Alg238-R41 TaxID=2993447 RepID=UPI0022E6DADF|nr:J domain-containing protein [Marinicauda sp. Alg238-R41]
MTEAYPLHWPPGRPRTKRQHRSRFDVTFARARDEMLEQVRLLGARLPVLSTNVILRRDGLPYANQPEPDDTGVAVYFEHAGKQMCFSCDRWDRVRDNIRAIGRTIEAMRGIERWGTGDMVAAAFSGFQAMPPPSGPAVAAPPPWYEVLGVDPRASLADCRAAYRAKTKTAHPDTPTGSPDAFARLQEAWERAQKSAT